MSNVNRPLEFFGTGTFASVPKGSPWDDLRTESASKPFKNVICPFMPGNNSLCNKIRKAAPNALIGSCSVRTHYGGESQDWMICPRRFLANQQIFHDAKHLVDSSAGKVFVTPEISLKHYGNLDYVMSVVGEDGTVVESIGIEVQGMGTSASGSIWVARNDFLRGKLKDDYKFGVNVRDASKKILVQLLHKVSQLSRWRMSTLLVIQDYFYDHLLETYNLDQFLHQQDPQDFIHIHTYSLVVDEGTNTFSIKIKDRKSTDMLGLSMALISNPGKQYLSRDFFDAAINGRVSKSVGFYI